MLDIVEANIKAMHSEDNLILNLGTGTAISVNRLFETISGMVGSGSNPTYAPERPGEIRNMSVDASAATKILGWQPKLSLEQGIKQTIEYYQTRER